MILFMRWLYVTNRLCSTGGESDIAVMNRIYCVKDNDDFLGFQVELIVLVNCIIVCVSD